ncbi:MAG: hypothetical protein IPI58_08855 [Alphaproteobacteria bacterium]|nr:MAG: hypothetical protein IPI58_08855 [Alphaproteobacteria bacterium]
MNLMTRVLVGISDIFPHSDRLARVALRAHKKDMRRTLGRAMGAATMLGRPEKGVEMIEQMVHGSLAYLERARAKGPGRTSLDIRRGVYNDVAACVRDAMVLDPSMKERFAHRIDRLTYQNKSSSKAMIVQIDAAHEQENLRQAQETLKLSPEAFVDLYERKTEQAIRQGGDGMNQLDRMMGNGLRHVVQIYQQTLGVPAAENVLQTVMDAFRARYVTRNAAGKMDRNQSQASARIIEFTHKSIVPIFREVQGVEVQQNRAKQEAEKAHEKSLAQRRADKMVELKELFLGRCYDDSNIQKQRIMCRGFGLIVRDNHLLTEEQKKNVIADAAKALKDQVERRQRAAERFKREQCAVQQAAQAGNVSTISTSRQSRTDGDTRRIHRVARGAGPTLRQ